MEKYCTLESYRYNTEVLVELTDEMFQKIEKLFNCPIIKNWVAIEVFEVDKSDIPFVLKDLERVTDDFEISYNEIIYRCPPIVYTNLIKKGQNELVKMRREDAAILNAVFDSMWFKDDDELGLVIDDDLPVTDLTNENEWW